MKKPFISFLAAVIAVSAAPAEALQTENDRTEIANAPHGQLVVSAGKTKRIKFSVSGGKRKVVLLKRITKSKKWRKTTVQTTNKRGRAIIRIKGTKRPTQYRIIVRPTRHAKSAKTRAFTVRPPKTEKSWVFPMLHVTPVAAADVVVSPSGSDSGAGTVASPYRTVQKGLQALKPGQTLVLRGGSYREQILNPTVARGSLKQPITVSAAEGERPVITGLFWLKNTDHWTFNGINVTWDSTNNASNQHMVKLTHGTGWTWKNAELWGAKSFAAMLVAGNANNYTIAGNYIHDTAATNGINQDHLLYVNTTGNGGGRIHHNLLVGSPNGRAVKVGPGASTDNWNVQNIEIDHNTMFDNQGPSNIQLAFNTSNIHIHHNIMVRSGFTGNNIDRRNAVTAHQLTGTGNIVEHNLYYETGGIADKNQNITVATNNIARNPQWIGTGSTLRSGNPNTPGYGHTS